MVTSCRADCYFEELDPILCAPFFGLKLPSYLKYKISVKRALFDVALANHIFILCIF